MTAFFLIFLYVTFELSYDSVYPKSDRILRIVTALAKAALVDPVKSLRSE